MLGIMAAKLSKAVEADGTWHSIPTATTVDNWRARTPDDFLFAAKMHKSITHEKMLSNTEADTEAFLSTIRHLGSKLGVVLLQFPQNFHSGYYTPLERFLSKLPTDVRFAVEIRSQSWMQGDVLSRYLDLLRKFNVAHVISDSWGVDYGEHLTTDLTYLRLNANDIMPDVATLRDIVKRREKELDHWAELILRFSSQVNMGYCFINDCFEHSAVDSVQSFQRRLGMPVVPLDRLL